MYLYVLKIDELYSGNEHLNNEHRMCDHHRITCEVPKRAFN